MNPSEVLENARALRSKLSEASAAIEKNRRLPSEIVDLLARAGCFRLVLPRQVGGSEASAREYLEVLEEVARGDASAGWCVMIATTSSLISAFVDDESITEMFSDPLGASAGVFAPTGRAERVPGGYKVDGRWSFGSGCEHAAWRMGGVVVSEPNAPPQIRQVMLRAEETEVLDTWNVAGLSGTGSHDFVAKGVFVPERRSFSMLTDEPRFRTGIHALPLLGALAMGIAAVALGTARTALESFILLAKQKKPGGAKRSIAEREMVQATIAQAEATLGSARAYLHHVTAEAEQAILREPKLDLQRRAKLRLAATHATHAAAETIGKLYRSAGGTAIYSSHSLQRHFRDVNVMTQHIMVSDQTLVVTGRALLGLEIDPTLL